jgi:cytochrome oxidase Cu insertion factor (SCO1/SenC/PrrC family)
MNLPIAPPSRTRSRLSLLLIVAVFAVPVLAALALNLAGWMPGHSRNFGEVVHPPLPLRDIEFVLADDARMHLGNTQERWTLLVRVPATCDAACWQRVALLGNVRTSLGRVEDKLDLLLLVERELPAGQQAVLHDFAFATSATRLPGRLSAPLTQGPELWLVNPYGSVEMRYAPGYLPAELRKDLGKLIR